MFIWERSLKEAIDPLFKAVEDDEASMEYFFTGLTKY